MSEEIDEYMDMLLGRTPLPVNNGIMSLMESATYMFARAGEITGKLQEAESKGYITRGSQHYKFRTGKLRTFMDVCSKTIELGSRHVTWASKEAEMREWG